MGGGLSALHHIHSLQPTTRTSLQQAITTLTNQAHSERATDSSKGRIMLGICASNAPEALGGLKSWVAQLTLPRGMLHGMDVDGVPIPVEELGSVYVKYSTGGAMTFREMRKSGRGFDALWRPGDALLEMYDGDFRGVYFSVELGDGVFRQFGVLPTDLFMEEEEDCLQIQYMETNARHILCGSDGMPCERSKHNCLVAFKRKNKLAKKVNKCNSTACDITTNVTGSLQPCR
eukprot:scaffold7048_cov117-Skeletonema_dohrnii-CCMP3373.AAC.2